jgi:hypothetical protein
MSIFSYPVDITVEEIKNETGIDLVKEYGSENVRLFMNILHSNVYDGAIYATGAREIKDRIIEAHKTVTENAIKRALLMQATYLHEEGNIGTESGITITADGQKAVVSKADLRAKTVCVAAIDALKSCACALLYAGEL